MSALTITHTHEAGTLVDGTSRSIGAWYVPHSRDRIATGWKIDQTAAALRVAGFSVDVDIDNTPRGTAEVEIDKQARQAGRVDALTTKADRKHATAEGRWAAADRAHNALPPGGEPVKIGHHSAPSHLRAIDRAHDTIGKAITADADAAEADRRLREAAAGTGARNSAITVGNRIETLAADVRRMERDHSYSRARAARAGTDPDTLHVQPELVQARDQLGYWRAQRAAAIAAGDVVDHGRHNVRAGDQVQIGGSWYNVRRANTKTVRVDTRFGPQPTPWHEVTDHRPAAPSPSTAAPPLD